MRKSLVLLGAALPLVLASGAAAQGPEQRPAETDSAVKIEPILDTRLRFEDVEQGALDAKALTLRIRPGVQAKAGAFSVLAEAEGTLAPVNNYNAFPFPLIGESQRRPEYAVIPDPENLELNRLQVQYKAKAGSVTLGRQRINLDDQRWVGSVGWRQNEQTFDAVRGEAKAGPVSLDLTCAVGQRTLFGRDAGPRTKLDGDFIFAGAASKIGPVQAKVFSYLLDYDEPFYLTNSSQTYGALVSGAVPLGGKNKITLRASYARQSDFADNPFDYAADYWSVEGGTDLAGFGLAAGWEQLGSDNGRSVQTPMATLHKFNGWADLFLTTPPAGLDDAYVTVGRKVGALKPFGPLQANVTYHRFRSATGGIAYGTEWDASLGTKVGPVGLLLKYADYDAKDFGVNTRKLWLQAEWAL